MSKRRAKPAPSLDLSYVSAAPVLLRNADQLNLYLVGCGGSGSWLAPDVARLAVEFRSHWKTVDVTFIDPDIVEPVNIPRQNFCQAEIRRRKAETLAARYGSAWGIEIAAVADRFQPGLVERDWQGVSVILGAVDNAAARRSIADTLERNDGYRLSVWWLDCVRPCTGMIIAS